MLDFAAPNMSKFEKVNETPYSFIDKKELE